MEDDGEDWSDCEENTLIVEIQGIIDPDFLSKVEKARVLGIDTETPYLQLEDNTFSGTYQEITGTSLLFKEINQEETDTIEESEEVQHQLEFAGKSSKKLTMQRLFIKSNADKKKSEEQGSQGAETKKDIETSEDQTDSSNIISGQTNESNNGTGKDGGNVT